METQQTDQQTGQQATNAALAALAAAGNAFALGQLWEINQGFVRRQLWQWYEKNKPVADAAGLVFEDLVQEGYFALVDAVRRYDPERGAFTTCLGYALKYQLHSVLCGEHGRQVETADGRLLRVAADPLNTCASLDLPIAPDEDSSRTLGDLQPDPAASQAFQHAEDSLYTQQLHAALEEALAKLAERDALILRLRYYDGQTQQAVGQALGIKPQQVQQIEIRARQRLARCPALRCWREDIISRRAYQGTGFSAWVYGCSVEERILEELERLGLA